MTPVRAPIIEAQGAAQRSSAWTALREAAVALEDCATDPDIVAANRVVERRFRFLNVERQIPEIDWSAPYVSALWSYHLQYFDFAVELVRAWRATADGRFLQAYLELWADWLDAAARGTARIEPYPTSIRCLNALHSLWLAEDSLPGAFSDRLLSATHAQLVWLANHLELHLRANHLQKNLTALTWGNLAFKGQEAARWRDRSEALWGELREQVLPDGGHFERSPMYHAAALEDFLRTLALCKAADVEVPPDVYKRLGAMTEAIQWLARPDGSLHLFNDAADGRGPGRAEIVALARVVLREPFREPAGTLNLPTTGYFGYVEPGGGQRLVIDAGPPGPAYQPGHAHCDMLSFELDIAGRRVVVDSGVHGYNGDSYREYVRSTRAHNTVAVDGGEQHEMWATFRVARRGEIVEAAGSTTADGAFEFRGACRPYHDRGIVHHRSMELRIGRLSVTDHLDGAQGRSVSSWLHLHPDLRVEPSESSFVLVAGQNDEFRVVIEPFGADSVRVRRGEVDPIQGWYCPQFGLACPAPVLELRRNADDGSEFGWRLRWT